MGIFEAVSLIILMSFQEQILDVEWQLLMGSYTYCLKFQKYSIFIFINKPVPCCPLQQIPICLLMAASVLSKSSTLFGFLLAMLCR